jgi:protein-tyrosine phosphatase
MILFVCEGNVCRSPLAAALLVRALAEGGVPLDVASAGTRALVGAPADEHTRAVARRENVDLEGHRARQLDRQTAEAATLLLAASRRVRSEAVAIHPPAVQYAFTIRQLERILVGTGFDPSGAPDPEQRIREVRAHTIRHRGLQALRDPAQDDVVDPYGGSLEVHAEAMRQIGPGVSALARALGLPSGR